MDRRSTCPKRRLLLLLFVPLLTQVVCQAAENNNEVAQGSECVSKEFLEEQPEDRVRDAVSRGQRDFSVNLIKSLFNQTASVGAANGDTPANVFTSPSSIFQTLMLAYFGAGGETERELAEVMGFAKKPLPVRPDEEGSADKRFQDLDKETVKKVYLFERAFQAVRERNPELGYKLIHVNKMFFDRSLALDQCLVLLLNTELGAVDFAGNAEKARNLINTWVEDKTLGKINELLPSGAVDQLTKAALVNAAYFKGNWKSQFKVSDTRKDNFYVSRDKIVVVDFMEQRGPFNYYPSEELVAHFVELPYAGEDLSMIIILPPFDGNDSLSRTVSRMTPENIQGVMAELKSGFYKADDDLRVRLPKFAVEQSMDLASTLADLGVTTLFNSAKSNLTNFLTGKEEVKDGPQVTLGSALHKSFIEVNEEGSEAAAATALFGFRSARPLFHKEFIANHPFMYFIYDHSTETILFFGVMQNPQAI